MASSSTATHNQTELENAFEQPAPDSTRSPKRFQASSSTSAEPSRVSQQTQPDPQNAFDQLAPFRASTSTEPCQIFINHRGSDVKYTLASKIYQTLDGMGFRAFLDVEALEPGDVIPAEIQAAMTSASLHIAIFSPNYAQSPWCLAELSFMLRTGAKIIPVFYHVDPSDLRRIEQGKGIYAHAFSEHRKKGRYTQEKLDEWQKALHDISFHSGWSINNNEDEGRVLKNIVNCALKVMKNVPLWVAEHPLGLDELVQDIESIVSVEKVKFTGIVGMGGSGKTTLAKELFNRNFSSFERCSFVSDVRDAASRKAMPDKQKKLLKDLGVHHSSFENVDEGKAILANRLRSLRVLIVLDDVDHIDQVNALLPRISDHIDQVNALHDNHTLGCNLGSQSMVILTTRELGVLKSCGLSPSCIYKMRGLNRSHAEQLFCWHAFLKPAPPTGFETLVQKFIETCDGLPLSLKVLGGQLYGRDSRDYWESQLNKISRILPGDIQKRLRVSYDALDKEEKEMFLDVACFLIGERKSTAIAVWDGMQLSGLHGLETLVNKCLVELVRQSDYRLREWSDKIRMHDHLRDMGREIASGRSPYRLWCPEQIDNIKKHFKKKMLFRGIWPAEAFVALKEYTYQLMGNSSRRSKRLRLSNGLQILSVKGNEFTEEFASLSEDLVWLRWEDFPLRNIPSWLTLRHLTVLEINCKAVENELEELWDDNADPPSQLRELIIGDSYSLERLPSSIGRLQYLKKLSCTFYGSSLPKEFYGLQSLEYLKLIAPALSTLSAGFGNLRSLRDIKLACKQLSTLPDSFSQLIHLENLVLSYCEMLSSLPVGFGNLISLRNIKLVFCTQLSTLPDSFSQLVHLEELDLMECEMLSSLPVGFGNLISLRNIKLVSCMQLSILPDSFSQLIHLEYLCLSFCVMLSSLPAALGNLISLKHINLSPCKQLSTLPDSFKQLIHLEVLNLSECEMLSSLPAALGNLISLKHINLCRCKQLSTLPDSFKQLIHLEDLNLSECEMLSSALGNLISLKHINLSRCKQLSTLPDSFKQLIHLEDLNLSECEMLSSLPAALGNLISLKHINLSRCKQLSTLPDSFKQLTHLEDLNLSKCEMLSSLPAALGNLISLKHINLSWCKQLSTLPDSFKQLTHLEDLNLSECEMLSSLPAALGNLISLKHINLSRCKQLSTLPDSFKQLIHLEVLNLSECEMLSSLPAALGNLISLKFLIICFSNQLSTLPDSFSQLIHLEYLYLSECEMLSSLPAALGNLISLTHIYLRECKQLSTLPDSFSQLVHLEYLDLSDCEMLSTLPVGFGNLISLKHIDLSQCKQLSTLPNSFSQLIHLEDLDLSGCEMLSSLPAALGNLKSLKHINLSQCKQLSTLPDSFNQLIHLEDLNLSRCAKLKLKLDMLENIRKLKVLKLAYCEQLEDLPHQIMNQESLTELNLEGCIKLRGSAANIGELVKLQSLIIENLMLESLQTSLVNFSSLKKITIVNTTYAGDEDCKQVSRLSISNDHCPILETFEVRWNRHLTEIETLPVSLKELSIEYCKVLKSIRCISSLVRLEKLKISDCPKIEEFSSSAGLASLKEFSMKNCPKVEQIEGLQHSKSLKKLSLEGTCWKVPGIQSLEEVERLDTLVLECDTISALKPCIQSTKAKECLRRMEIKVSVSRFVKPIVNSLEFPQLEVREVENLYDAREIIDSLNSPAFLCYVEGKEESDVEGKEENDEERKVVSICVSLDDIIAADFLLKGGRLVVYREEVKAMVVAGEEGRVW